MGNRERAGVWVSNLSGELQYRSFRPSPLPPDPAVQIDSSLGELLVRAHRELAQLSGAAEFLPNVDLFVSMYVRKEALISSQIEGTQCTLEDILDPEVAHSANAEVADVVNYVAAERRALELVKELPLSGRLLRRAHEVLLQGVRGEEKTPGEFRRSQNWIGPAGCTLKEARFVPPNVEDMQRAMSDLECYMNEADDLDPLVRAALIHYQFETIHPFLDGNGRVGRLLILLYLMQEGLLSKPVLYVSYFLKRNQVEYYDRMSEVRRSGNYEQWVRFFLEAVYVGAEDACGSIRRLVAMHDRNLEKVKGLSARTDTNERLFAHLEEHPIVTAAGVAEALGMSFATASSAIKRLEAVGILAQSTNAARNRVFSYEEYLAELRRGAEL